MANPSTPKPDRPRPLTPNERLYVSAWAGSNRLLFCVLTAIAVPTWLALTIAITVFTVYLAKASAGLALAMFLAVLWLGYVLSGVMPALWRACSTKAGSPWVDPFKGELSFLTIETGESEVVRYPFIGSREAIFPDGWLDHIAEGESLRGYCYPVKTELVRPGAKSIILALDNGLTVDREVDLGLLRITGFGYWIAALICGAVWGIGPGLLTLAEVDLPRIVSLWVPGAITGSLLAAAVIGTIRNKAIRPRLDSLRRQCLIRKVE